jgi:hypothetical protein
VNWHGCIQICIQRNHRVEVKEWTKARQRWCRSCRRKRGVLLGTRELTGADEHHLMSNSETRHLCPILPIVVVMYSCSTPWVLCISFQTCGRSSRRRGSRQRNGKVITSHIYLGSCMLFILWSLYSEGVWFALDSASNPWMQKQKSTWFVWGSDVFHYHTTSHYYAKRAN